MPKIVYLEARGKGRYRSGMRSDTLWGMLCWTLKQLAEATGDQEFDLPDLIKRYGSKEATGCFYLSSAFPWLEQDGRRTHYLPSPLAVSEPMDQAGVEQTPRARKRAARLNKLQRERTKGWLSWEQFDEAYGSGQPSEMDTPPVKVATEAVTHNQIDRARLGTLRANDAGQLFHMNENYLDWGKKIGVPERHGLYFLLDGDTERVEAALRLLETLGMGGDRSVGKGAFRIEILPDAYDLNASSIFEQPQQSLPKPQKANARMTLSLYHPGEGSEKWADLRAYEQAAQSQGTHLWQYKLEHRRGRNVQQALILQDAKLLFAEGSIFPKTANEQAYPGKNWWVGKHALGHDIYRYGHAFMLDIALPDPAAKN